MKKTASLLLQWTFAFAIGACSHSTQAQPTRTPASPSAEIEAARETLTAYFDELYSGEYASAASRYGGELTTLIDSNPDVDPADASALFEAACTYQLRCLPVRSIVFARQIDTATFEFSVEFSNPDGSLFILGPCCGATETEMPPISQFDCAVEKTGAGKFEVLCLPVYVP
jgi:hypothetical protein